MEGLFSTRAESGSMRNKCYGDDQQREHCLLALKYAHFQQQQALAIQLRELQGEDLRSYVRAHLERVDRDTAAFAHICQARLEPQSDNASGPAFENSGGQQVTVHAPPGVDTQAAGCRSAAPPRILNMYESKMARAFGKHVPVEGSNEAQRHSLVQQALTVSQRSFNEVRMEPQRPLATPGGTLEVMD